MPEFSLRSIVLLTLLLLLCPPLLAGQEPADSTGAPTVRAIEIRRYDIFDPDESSGFIARMANGLHITTRSFVVDRELLFHAGQPWDSALVAETERNLRSLGLFRRVEIDSIRTDSGLIARVTTHDGWSTKADVRFRSTGGEVEYGIGITEDNVGGTATQASVRFRKNPDRTRLVFGFLQPRFILRTLRLGLEYEDRSDGRLFAAQVGKPFYSLAQKESLLLYVDTRDERILRFFNGEDDPSDSLRRNYTLVRVDGAIAPRADESGYTRLGFAGQVRRDDYRPEGLTGLAPARTVTGAAGPVIEWRQARFVVTEGFLGFAREEDVDVSNRVRLGLLAAPAAFGYDRDGLAPDLSVRLGTTLGPGFLFVDGHANGMFTSAGLDSGLVQVGATVAARPGRRHVAIVHAEAGWQKKPLPGEEFDLGLGVGPRAFRSHAFTGDRAFFLTGEYRYTVAEDLFDVVGVGLAGFVDHGGAWYSGSPRRSGWDAGVGLRLGASRAASVEAIRVDLARRFGNDAEGSGWVLVIGKGFTFSTRGGGVRAVAR